MPHINLEHILPLQEELDQHLVYQSIRGIEELRIFMNHHVYSVWDFMSLVKYMQQQLAPVQLPWIPAGNPTSCFFINQLVLEEESDRYRSDDGTTRYASHFEMYLQAMSEVGADTETANRFLSHVAAAGVKQALNAGLAPEPASTFSKTTFCFINEGKPHVVAAALALGRERVIPGMFRQFLSRMRIDRGEAPLFHYYLERHIELDGDYHGPMAIQMLEELCGADAERLEEAEAAAKEAIRARIRFWDGVHEAVKQARS